MSPTWLYRHINSDVQPGDIPYRTTDPIPDEDNPETTRRVQKYYRAMRKAPDMRWRDLIRAIFEPWHVRLTALGVAVLIVVAILL